MKRYFLFVSKGPVLYAALGAGVIYAIFEALTSVIAFKNHDANFFKENLVLGFFIFLIAIFLLTIFNTIVYRKITVLKMKGKNPDVKEGDQWVFRVSIRMNLKKGVSIIVPVKIKLDFSGSFQAEDLKKLMSDNNFKSEESMTMFSFIKQTFFERNPKLYDIDIFDEEINYFEAALTVKKVKEGALRRVSFPGKLFSNVGNTDLKIGKARFEYIERDSQ